MTGLTHVAVVIPARDESELISRCLRSIVVASRRLATRTRGRVSASVVVVADGCVDDTAALARNYPVSVLEVEPMGVGAARAFGVGDRLRVLGMDARRLWIANTDADSIVDESWLVSQVAAADRGADALVGGVRPEFSDLTAAQVNRWRSSHSRGAARTHVHGANLGFRASAYIGVGGFRPLPEHEDVDLIERMRAGDAHIRYSGRTDVVTSGRAVGRTPGGYAGYLRSL
jgi:glycosyltransferase involved in cell wall biosynthesis